LNVFETYLAYIDEVRIRHLQTSSRAEGLLNKIRDLLHSGVELAEEKVGDILPVLGGKSEEAKMQTHKVNVEAAKSAEKAASSAQSVAQSLSAEAVKASKKVCLAKYALCW
jgi:hypothetical protein